MRNFARVVGVSSVLLSVACGGGGSQAGGAKVAVQPDAASFSGHGLSVDRPGQWLFVNPDPSVAADTVVILQGPVGDKALAPVVEIGRRALSAADQRRSPSHILTALAGEIAQTYDTFELKGEAAEVQVGGRPASRLDMTLVETLSDGAQESRLAQVYAVVDGEQLWLVRCFGPADGSAGAAFDAIVQSIKL
jgi:hypothetical protein